MSNRRLLLVHAHPDDESINNGATMAKYVADGASVTLVTCTAGEEGEVVAEDIAHHASAHDDRLGETRQLELAEAMAALGVQDHRFLGGFGRFRDSGMMGTKENERPECFWRADLLAAATELVCVIRQVRPQVLVTYDEFGGYGHPDHIQAHRVAMYGAALAAAPSYRADLGAAWEIEKVYWNAMPRRVMQQAIETLRQQGIDNEFTQMDVSATPFLCDDELVSTRIDGGDFVDQKLAALRAHRSQLDVDTGFFQVLTQLDRRGFGIEHYRLVKGQLGQVDSSGFEPDLFSGVRQ